jgi:hypothetical protein
MKNDVLNKCRWFFVIKEKSENVIDNKHIFEKQYMETIQVADP